MLSRVDHPHKIAAVLCLLALPLVPSLARPAYYASSEIPQSNRQDPVPEATKPCSDDESKWWKNLREAVRVAIAARIELDSLENRLFSGYRVGQVISDAEISAINRRRKEEQAKLNADIESSTARFLGLLREGSEKSYRVPLDDRRPQLLYGGRPSYSEEARQKKIEGSVLTRVRIEADGTIGDVRIMRGLGHGLDESAVISMKRTLWLPCVKDGVFVQYWSAPEVEFNLR